MQYNFERETTILVFDFGGGTFDVSILSIKDGTFRVRSTAGDTHLGGEDMDNRMVNHFVQYIRKKYNRDISEDPRALRRLRTACEKAKRMLSTATTATVEVDSLFNGTDFNSYITRARFEDLNMDLFRSTLGIVDRAIRDAKIQKSEIDEIVLVGGSTRIPKVQKMIQEFFNGKQLSKGINPDEAVAYGAAIRAGSISGDASKEVKDMVLLDVTPLTLGTDVHGGIMSVIIERNTTIPVRKTRKYKTVHDNQTKFGIGVYEGERSLVNDNNLLGKFSLRGIPPAPRGKQKHELTFDIDANGILSVSAFAKSTGERNGITIVNERGHLSTEEIQRLIDESEKFRAEDRRRKESIEARNRLEYYCLDTKRDLTHVSNSSFDKQSVIAKCDEVLRWLEFHQDSGKETFESQLENLKREFGMAMRIGNRATTDNYIKYLVVDDVD